MKKIWLVAPVVLAILIGLFLIRPETPVQQEASTPSASSPTPGPVDFTASFEIVTLGTTRTFTAERYHNLSSEVYITSDDPNTVHVKADGVTWADFFQTLPMKLTKKCLTTGTGQVFCTNETDELKFFINDTEDPQALNKKINSGDKLLVIYE